MCLFGSWERKMWRKVVVFNTYQTQLRFICETVSYK